MDTKTEKTFDLKLTRIFEAPRELVFQCWSDPEHLERWQCCPEFCEITFRQGEYRPGGMYKVCMRHEGTDNWLVGEYLEIAPPERIVMTHGWLEDDGSTKTMTELTLTFTDAGEGRTRLDLHQRGLVSADSRDGHGEGWNSTFDRFAKHLRTLDQH
jgi:uncharacterized protein YndB with AHSA1/START domain